MPEGALVAIPAHDEDRFIGSLVLKLRADGHPVLVVDDGSNDRTAAVAEAAGAMVLRHERNRGKTAAVATAFARARELDVAALVLMDGDSQHDPRDVAAVARPVIEGRADMVVGSRYGEVRSEMPAWRVLGQRTLTAAANIGSGLRLSDTESGFRAFSRRAIDEMRFRGSGFSIEPEFQFEARRHAWTVVEVAIGVHYGAGLPRKRNVVWQGMRTMNAILRLVGEHRPLLFFSLPGLVVFLAGVGLGLYVLRVYEESLQLAVGLAILTVLLCVLGMLSFFVGFVLHTMRRLFGEYLQRPR